MDFYEQFHWGRKAKRVVKRKGSPSLKTGVKLGRLHSVTYLAKKGKEPPTLWEHEFGEDGGKQPDLVMDIDSKKLHIVGGTYDVQDIGIVD